MSAKLISSFKDENPNLQKQMGCMNGIFQLFDRHHFLTGRRLWRHYPKKLLPGPNHNVELTNATQEAMERNGKELGDEKHRTSTESSRISSSSSFSSLDHDTTVQPDRTRSSWHNFTETPPQTIPIQQHNSSPPPGRRSLDLRDVVKESMYRGARGVSIKTVSKEEGRTYVMKHIDSPRPLPNRKSTQPRVTGADGSIRAFAKHQESPWISREEKNSLFQLGSKEPSRFSYDGREWRDAAKSSIKLKELPRLSLDSRDIRSPACELRSNSLQRDLSGEKGNCSHILNLNQEPSSNKCSSVIAKLMGLEEFPYHVSANQSKINIPDQDSVSRSSQTADGSRQNQVPPSPWVLSKDPASPRPSKSNSVKKPTSCSRFPIEQAPWRQQDTSRKFHNPAVKNRVAPGNAPHASSSIYGEIERRITDLEFKRSGKDLRALKQILEAMQKTRHRLEHQVAEEVDLESQTSRCSPEYSSCSQDFKPLTWQNQQDSLLAPTIKGTSPPKTPESSVVIMKPVKLVDKFSSPPVTAADLSPLQKLRIQDARCNRVDLVDEQISQNQRPMKSNLQEPGSCLLSVDNKKKGRTSKAVQISKETKHAKGEYLTAPAKNSGTKSPRSQQKQRGIDKQNGPNPPPSDLHRARMQSKKTHAESGSPNRKLKVKSANLQRGDDRISELNRETRACYHQDDTASLQSESNNSLVSQMDTDITSTDRSENASKQQGDCKDRDPASRLSKGMPIAELAITTTEQPSPVSVLDSTFYGEDSPSPVKKISTAFTDEEPLDADEAEWSPESLAHLQKIRSLNLGLEFNNKKLENIKDLVHKLKLLNPEPDEATTDSIGSLCYISNPDHRYITKILLASGLLRDVSFISTPIQLHSSGHVINPNLFHVLEQTEAQTKLVIEEVNGKTTQLKLNEGIHRKILFDTVNEILVCKLSLENSFLPGRRTQSGQELLKQLHSEVDHLQTISNCSLDDEDDQLVSILNADMTHQSKDWTGYHSEIPALVLDIERLIFKDLISKVINDEIAYHQNWQRRNCRKLFTN